MGIEKNLILKSSVDLILKSLISSGKYIVAPVQRDDAVYFEKIDDKSIVAEDFIQSKLSAKSLVFPPYEELFGFRKAKGSVTIENTDVIHYPEMILWGAKPCDAAGFLALSSIFNGDYSDKIYNTRKDNLTLITFSCNRSDESCFCTSVEGSPGNTEGSDLLFTRINTDTYIVEIITEKGRTIANHFKEYLLPFDPSVVKENFLAKIDAMLDQEVIKRRLERFFESEIWSKQSERCLGCGACAFVCPTCGCFDIQDETFGNLGNRLRCWDSCGFAMFTIHASGHNPRDAQNKRWRQRLMHKFSIMPERSKIIGCTGCGRCSRACPVDMNLLEHLTSIMKMNDER